MGNRMIPVRHRETNQETKVGESAYPYFAGAYERLDQPAERAPEKPQTAPDKSASKRPAATKDKEENDGR
jgi:hypothetical protein